MAPRRAAARWPRALGFHAAALAVAAVFLVPGLWVLAASLRRPGLPPPATIEWLPDPVAWSNYARIFEILPLARYLANSLLIAGLAVPLTILVASWAGFAMAQLPPRARYTLLAARCASGPGSRCPWRGRPRPRSPSWPSCSTGATS
jgi:multiple sugar transport system permease protein